MTDTITIPHAVYEQVLEALENVTDYEGLSKARRALRSALEQRQDDPFAPALYTGQPIPEIEQRNKETVRLADPQDPIKAWGDAQPQQVIDHYEAALKAAFPEGAQGKVYEHWNEARRLQQEIKP